MLLPGLLALVVLSLERVLAVLLVVLLSSTLVVWCVLIHGKLSVGRIRSPGAVRAGTRGRSSASVGARRRYAARRWRDRRPFVGWARRRIVTGPLALGPPTRLG